MKALSIKQPYASLIVTPRIDNPKLGIKDIENRTWRTHFRGTVLIHASGKALDITSKLLSDEQGKALSKFIHENNDKFSLTSPVSAIIGEVDIIDCVINHESIWAENCMASETNKIVYNWVLANPVLYDEPILNVKGKLSFWEFEKKTK